MLVDNKNSKNHLNQQEYIIVHYRASVNLSSSQACLKKKETQGRAPCDWDVNPRLKIFQNAIRRAQDAEPAIGRFKNEPESRLV